MPLGTGTILPSFQAEGNTPVDIERLQRVINWEVMLVAVHFSILAEMPSLPTDLVVSRLMRRSKIESSVHSRSSGQSLSVKSSELQAESLFLQRQKIGIKTTIEVIV